MWMLGLAFALMTLGVLSVDLWALIAERSELTALADAAALAGVSAVDEAAWRSSQILVLVGDEAVARAWEILGDRDLDASVEVDGVEVRVRVSRTVETALLGLAGRAYVTVGASSQAMAAVRD
jgi:hypothetical protein